jgi:transcriptional repressor NrdR
MNCPYCKSDQIRVVDKRDQDTDNVIRRRRECDNCGKRFTTYEHVEKIDAKVTKTNGDVELFDREKLKKSILKSLTKEVDREEIAEKIVEDIESHILQRKDMTVSSKQLGSMILTRLKRYDKTAYIRYASVYKNFDNLQDFINEIKTLIQE